MGLSFLATGRQVTILKEIAYAEDCSRKELYNISESVLSICLLEICASIRVLTKSTAKKKPSNMIRTSMSTIKTRTSQGLFKAKFAIIKGNNHEHTL